MLNYRRVDKKFSISGGWNNLPENVAFLKDERVAAVLDLQFTDWDSNHPLTQVSIALEDANIDYSHIKMFDDLNGTKENTIRIIRKGADTLESFVEKHPKEYERILVKCAAGISRSPTVYLAYLCQANRWTYDEASEFLYDQERELHQMGLLYWPSSPNFYFRQFLGEMYGRTEYVWPEKLEA